MDRLAQFGGIFVLVAAALAVLQLWDHLHQEGWVKGETLSLLLFSVVGMMLFAATTNLVVLFLALELLSLPLYALTATVRMREKALEGGMKYFLTGAVASAIFLMGSVLLYGATGSLDIAVIGARLGQGPGGSRRPGRGRPAAAGLPVQDERGAVPPVDPGRLRGRAAPGRRLHVRGHQGRGGARLMRVMARGPARGGRCRCSVGLAVLAVLSLVLGNLAALAQTNIKRMLAYSSISHAGYLLLGLVAATPGAYAGMLFYLLAYLAMNMGAFGVLSAFGLVGDEVTFEQLKGLGWKRPGLGDRGAACACSPWPACRRWPASTAST